MQNKKYWEKVKTFIKKHFSKKSFVIATAFVLIHGIVALLGVAGITSFIKNNHKSEVIMLPQPESPEEIFDNRLKTDSLVSIKDVNEEYKDEEKPSYKVEEEKDELKQEEEVIAVFKEEKKEEFKPEFSENIELLNDYTGEKLVKSKTMKDWRAHLGIDIKAELGKSVYAVESGTVTKVYDDDFYGTTIEISHAGGFCSVYSNLDKNVNAREGDTVEKGKEIGIVGNSARGEKNEAPHLHFELLKDGEQINPKDYIKY